MLCERCQTNEASVHFSALAWPAGEFTKHLCASCYPQEEALRTGSYGSKPKPLPVIDAEHVTAEEYFAFSARATRNSADAPAYRWLSAELEHFPATRERLAEEILTRALQALETGGDAWGLIGLGSCFGNSVPGPKSLALVELLEKIFLSSVGLMAQSESPPANHPFGLGLTMAGKALRRADPARFLAMVERLKVEYRGNQPAGAVFKYLERRESEKWGR